MRSHETIRAAVTSDYRFAPIPEDLLYDPAISDLAVRVYGVLARHGMTPESCYPSHARIAGFCGCSPRSIQRPLRALEDAGWITRVPRYSDTGERTSDGFIVRTTPAPPAHHSAPSAHHSADPPAHHSAEAPRTGARRTKAMSNESKRERDDARDRASERALFDADEHAAETTDLAAERVAAGFDAFWAVYPRRTAKGAARSAWPAAVKAAGGIDVIVEGARRYRDDPNREDAFTAHPATWLRGERWDDPPLPPRGGRPANASRVDQDRSAPSGRITL